MSLVFDNTDKAHSPLGYEQHDEITVTRQVRVVHVAGCVGWCACGFRATRMADPKRALAHIYALTHTHTLSLFMFFPVDLALD